MKYSYLPSLILSLISFVGLSQTAITKNSPFTEKTMKMSEAVTVRYETEAPAVYSNPTNQTQIAFENKNHQPANLLVFNSENKEVQVMYSKSKNEVQETYTIYTSQLAVGTYTCKVEVGSNVISRKLIISR